MKQEQENKLQTAHALKEHFLDIAKNIVDEYVGAALGTSELNSYNATCREEVWDLAKKLMLGSGDKIKITTSCPEDVIKAVEAGECTLREGEQLLKMYESIRGKNVPNFTVNILGAPERLKELPYEVG